MGSQPNDISDHIAIGILKAIFWGVLICLGVSIAIGLLIFGTTFITLAMAWADKRFNGMILVWLYGAALIGLLLTFGWHWLLYKFTSNTVERKFKYLPPTNKETAFFMMLGLILNTIFMSSLSINGLAILGTTVAIICACILLAMAIFFYTYIKNKKAKNLSQKVVINQSKKSPYQEQKELDAENKFIMEKLRSEIKEERIAREQKNNSNN